MSSTNTSKQNKNRKLTESALRQDFAPESLPANKFATGESIQDCSIMASSTAVRGRILRHTGNPDGTRAVRGGICGIRGDVVLCAYCCKIGLKVLTALSLRFRNPVPILTHFYPCSCLSASALGLSALNRTTRAPHLLLGNTPKPISAYNRTSAHLCWARS